MEAIVFVYSHMMNWDYRKEGYMGGIQSYRLDTRTYAVITIFAMTGVFHNATMQRKFNYFENLIKKFLFRSLSLFSAHKNAPILTLHSSNIDHSTITVKIIYRTLSDRHICIPTFQWEFSTLPSTLSWLVELHLITI